MTPSHSSEKKLRAVSLRKRGTSFRNIAQKLSISVSTAHLWTKGVILPKESKQKIIAEHRQRLIAGRDAFIAQQKADRSRKETKIFLDAKREVQRKYNDTFFMIGLALYWAEGFKKDHSLGFVNSDPTMIILFLDWLKLYGKCDARNVRLRVQIHEVYKSHIDPIKTFWSELTDIPISQFQKTFYQKSRSRQNFVDATYKGQLRIRVIGARNTFVRILGYLEGMKELRY